MYLGYTNLSCPQEVQGRSKVRLFLLASCTHWGLNRLSSCIRRLWLCVAAQEGAILEILLLEWCHAPIGAFVPTACWSQCWASSAQPLSGKLLPAGLRILTDLVKGLLSFRSGIKEGGGDLVAAMRMSKGIMQFSQFKPVNSPAVLFVAVLINAQPRDECDQNLGLAENRWFETPTLLFLLYHVSDPCSASRVLETLWG